jgi:hypothetical protein
MYIDIDLDDVITSMSSQDRQRVMDMLWDDGYEPTNYVNHDEYGILASDWHNAVTKLYDNRLRLSVDDEALIKQIVSKL